MSDLLRPAVPDPQFVMSEEGHRIATYSWGNADADPVLVVHGFASSCADNWVATQWVRELLDAGFRVVGVDQRGHGASDKPHDHRAFAMTAFVADLLIVLDTYLIDTVKYVGYSLGARVGWQFALEHPERVERAVLGGIPDGRPLARMQIDQALAYAQNGIPVEDPATRRYVQLAERVPGNDVFSLIALAEGMRLGDADPDMDAPPQQPILFATGTEDPIIERSRALAACAPHGRFAEIPRRHHFNAPGSRFFRAEGLAFLAEG